MITLGSLFDGIGVFPLAGALLGITPLWASEIDEDAIRVTSARFPEMDHLRDITKMIGSDIPPVDIITGGSPCQDLSTAGKQLGLAGARSGLFLEMVRIIREMREATGGRFPRWVLWENVTGALTSNKGADFGRVLTELAALAGKDISDTRPQRWSNAGAIVADDFSLIWRVLNARYWGVPQNRTRVFVMADFEPQQRSEPVSARKSRRMRRNRKTHDPQGSLSPGWSHSSHEATDYHDDPAQWIGDNVPGRLMERAAALGDVPPISVKVPLRQSFIESDVPDNFTSTKSYFQASYQMDLIGALTACDSKDPPIVIKRWGEEWDYARRLTPRECLRLQGLPQTWCDVYPAIPDRALYRMIGNSIALPCAEHMLSGIALAG